MTPATKHAPTAGASRAARAIERDASLLKSLPELVESRSPELVALARAALRRYADEAPRQAE